MCNTPIRCCPHCGGEADLTQDYCSPKRRYIVFVKCDVCGAQGKVYDSWLEPAAEDWQNAACRKAISAWNIRTGTEGTT